MQFRPNTLDGYCMSNNEVSTGINLFYFLVIYQHVRHKPGIYFLLTQIFTDDCLHYVLANVQCLLHQCVTFVHGSASVCQQPNLTWLILRHFHPIILAFVLLTCKHIFCSQLLSCILALISPSMFSPICRRTSCSCIALSELTLITRLILLGYV